MKKNKINIKLLSNNLPQANNYYNQEAEIIYSKFAEGVKNIAVVGSLGAGKSEAILTFLTKYKLKWWQRPKRFFKKRINSTKVSLASFEGREYKSPEIERSILQQLLYSKPKRLFHSSKIERIGSQSKFLIILAPLLITMFIFSTALFGLQLSGEPLFSQKFVIWLAMAFSVFSFLSLTYLSFVFRIFKKIKYKNLELHTTNNDSKDSLQESLISKFIDEVIYFFEKSKVNLVVFEDLDRLSDKKSLNDIFIKLRELNTVVNNSCQCKQSISFVYAVKDDLIESAEQRSKFFEFILPIVPFFNPNTRKNRMIEIENKLRATEPKLSLEAEFLALVAPYILDMRILKNTFNDYVISHNRIIKDTNHGTLTNEKLYVLCLYKNLFPSDYSLLEKGMGLIPQILNVDEIKKELKVNIQNRINELENRIVLSDNENIKNFDELKDIMRGQIVTENKPAGAVNFKVIDDLTTFETIDENTPKINLVVPNAPAYGNRNISIPIPIKLPNGDSYYEREKNISLKGNQERDNLSADIQRAELEISSINNADCCSIIRAYGIEKHIERVKKQHLNSLNNNTPKTEKPVLDSTHKYRDELNYLRFLINNDYIDGNYMEYVSNNDSDLFSENDSSFIEKIGQNDPVARSMQIDNVAVVVSSLPLGYFSNTLILNDHILNCLDEVKGLSIDKYNEIIQLLSDNDSYDVLVNYIQRKTWKEFDTLLIHLSNSVNVLSKLLSSSITLEKKVQVLTFIFNFISINDSDDDSKENLRVFINSVDDYESIISNELDINVLISKLISIAIKFNKVIPNARLTEIIIENKLYSINYHNIAVACDKSTIDLNDDVLKTIKAMNLYDYISTNFDDFTYHVLLNDSVSKSEENTKFVKTLISGNFITNSNKNLLIKKYPVTYDIVPTDEQQLYESLFQYDRVIPTWLNVLKYMHVDGLKPIIIVEYILRNITSMSTRISDGDDEQTVELLAKLTVEVMGSESRNDNMSNISDYADKINIHLSLGQVTSEIDDLVLNLFIEKGVILFNKEDFTILSDKKKSLLSYMKLHLDDVIDDASSFFGDLSSDLVGYFLESDLPNILKQWIVDEFADKIDLKNLKLVLSLSSSYGLSFNGKLMSRIISSRNDERVLAEIIVKQSKCPNFDEDVSIGEYINAYGKSTKGSKAMQYISTDLQGLIKKYAKNNNLRVSNVDTNGVYTLTPKK